VDAVLSMIVLAAEQQEFPLFFPAWVFPMIAAILFIFMGFVVHSFRDVSNRHSEKTGGSDASGHTTDH
jgi:hypothetical protein